MVWDEAKDTLGAVGRINALQVRDSGVCCGARTRRGRLLLAALRQFAAVHSAVLTHTHTHTHTPG